MNPIDDLRSNYQQFVKSETGKDFLSRILSYEMQLQTENYRSDTPADKKLSNMDKQTALYWVRTLLDDLSKPKPTPSVTRKRTPGSQKKLT